MEPGFEPRRPGLEPASFLNFSDMRSPGSIYLLRVVNACFSISGCLGASGTRSHKDLSHLIPSFFSHNSTAHSLSLPSPFCHQLISLKRQHSLYFQIQASGAGRNGELERPGCLEKGPRETWKHGRNESISQQVFI